MTDTDLYHECVIDTNINIYNYISTTQIDIWNKQGKIETWEVMASSLIDM